MPNKPNVKPARPWFSSGPTAKRPGWSSQALNHELLGRGIRAPEVVERFAHGLRLTRELLQVPDDWVLVYLPGSDTGAVEAALWNMLGERPVQVLAFENFGQVWATDIRDHLKLEPEVIEAPWGQWPDVSGIDPAKDLVFPWNGTTAGVKAPNADWIADDREGLVICDATSAAFAMALPWGKLDVVTFSFQKAMGGEAGLGVAAFSPRAVERLDRYALSEVSLDQNRFTVPFNRHHDPANHIFFPRNNTRYRGKDGLHHGLHISGKSHRYSGGSFLG